MADRPIDNPLQDDLPVESNRLAFVQPHVLNTIRLMHDPKDAAPLRWFDRNQSINPTMGLVQTGNEVTYLIRGEDTYRAMAEAIRSAVDSTQNHFIYLLGWILDDDFELIRGDPSSTIIRLFQASAAGEQGRPGVEIRAMLWANKANSPVMGTISNRRVENRVQVERINQLSSGRAILDDQPGMITSSHHQKILIVNGAQGLVAFCGGLDIHPTRVDLPGRAELGWQDVHCKIRGPSARSLLFVFLQRWMDHPQGGRGSVPAGDAVSKQSQPTLGRQIVQVGRTYPRHNQHDFAVGGEQTCRRMILKAIQQAERFIYMEDQYLVNMEASRALAQAMERIKHLTILMSGDGAVNGELAQAGFRRAEFIKHLKNSPGGDKVRVFITKPGTRFVHSKIYIIDDQFALIGSANCNRRGWESDSEVIAGITDQSSDEHPALHWAHRLRIKLWAQHLNMDTPRGHAELVDGVASVAHWINPPSGSIVEPYPLSNASAGDDTEWDQGRDPPSFAINQ